MDTLALLCNLYGDGPRTLASLRRNGVPDLPSLLTQEPKSVADWIGAKDAKRFLREAQLLQERSDADDADERDVEEERDELMAPVLERWREQDRSSPPVSARRAAQPPPAAPAPVAITGTPLAAGVLAGLDEDWVQRLAAAGVHDVEALAACRGDELAVRAGVPFTRVLRLVFLARRQVDSDEPATTNVAPQPVDEQVPETKSRVEPAPLAELTKPRRRTSFGKKEERFSPSERPASKASDGEPDLASWTRNGESEREKPSDGAGPFA